MSSSNKDAMIDSGRISL